MQPNNNNQPPLEPSSPSQPEASQGLPKPQVPSDEPAAANDYWAADPGPDELNKPVEPSFYGTTSSQQRPSPIVEHLPEEQPSQAPLVMTLPIWLGQHWKIVTASIIGAILVLIIAFQIVYPSSRILPGTVIDGVTLDYMRKPDAVEALNKAYGEMPLGIYFGSNEAPFQKPKFKDIGVGVNTEKYLAALDYPWYLRLIPTSFFWAAEFTKTGEMEYVYDKGKIDAYIESQVGDDCEIPAKDATLKLVVDKLQVVSAQSGGICDITHFQQALAATKPVAIGENKVNIEIREKAAYVDDDKARLLGNMLNDRASTPMPIVAGGSDQTITGKSVLSWLDFKSFIPELPANQVRDEDKIRAGSKLTFTVNRERMNTFMAGDIGKKVIIKAVANKVTTKDFTVTARVDGSPGREIDPDRTAVTVENYLNKKANKATTETRPVQQSTSYTRSYSPTSTGYRAALTQWPEEHEGTWAMTVTEVAGTKPFRSAHYRGDEPMPAGGTEAGYVGYAVVLAEQARTLLGSNKIAGRTPYKCFTDMIEVTDHECIKGFMIHIGHETLVKRGQELGLKNTTFAVGATKTTTNDLANFINTAFLTKLAPSANGGRILAGMQATRMRDGIQPALIKGNTATLAGELGTVHNDASLVYSPQGTYIFVVMSDKAIGRSEITELAKRIESIHMVKPPKVDS